ncbi:MAG: hypothetical protein M9913_12360 [Bryobacteraceae bacterium]|nr:hypothetical protein [Solibacteraceae bacterium]MCO5351666.1 hypothetical protein [Bryobacteraceae bacterium]
MLAVRGLIVQPKGKILGEAIIPTEERLKLMLTIDRFEAKIISRVSALHLHFAARGLADPLRAMDQGIEFILRKGHDDFAKASISKIKFGAGRRVRRARSL